jgi:hypothetical protein
MSAGSRVESQNFLRSSPRFGVAQENVLSPFRVRDHSLTFAARCRRTAFPSRAREQAVKRLWQIPRPLEIRVLIEYRSTRVRIGNGTGQFTEAFRYVVEGQSEPTARYVASVY